METPQLLSLNQIKERILGNCQDILSNTTLVMNVNQNNLLKLQIISDKVMQIAKIRANELKPESQEEYEKDDIVKLCKEILEM